MRSKHFLSLCLAVGSFAAAGLVAGCGSETTGSGGSGGGESGGSTSTTATTTTTGTPTTTGTTTTGTTTTGGTTTSTGTGGAEGDGNDSFADAVEIDPAGVQDTLQDPSTDVDYFKFEGKAGEVWLISSSSHFQAGTDEDPGYIDTFVELYDASNKLIATNDDSYPRFNTDSELITVLPATGTYYVKIQEWCTSPTMSPQACDDTYFNALINLDYSVFATAIPPGAGMVLETEPNDTGATANAISYSQTATAGSYYLTLLSGKLPMSSDSDWYSFTVPANL